MEIPSNLLCLGGLFLGDIPPEVTEDMLAAKFREYGEIDKVTIKVDKHTQFRLGYGFVYFKTSEPVKNILASTKVIVWIYLILY